MDSNTNWPRLRGTDRVSNQEQAPTKLPHCGRVQQPLALVPHRRNCSNAGRHELGASLGGESLDPWFESR